MNSTTGAFFEKNRRCIHCKKNGDQCNRNVSIKDVINDWTRCSIHIYKNPQEKKLMKILEQEEMKRKEEEEKMEIQKMLEEKVLQKVGERIADYTTKMEQMEKITTKYNALQEKFKVLKSVLAEVGVDMIDE